MKITIYRKPNCHITEKIKEFFRKRTIDFEEIIVQDEKIKQEIMKKSWETQFPIIEIKRNRSIGFTSGFNEIILNQMTG